MTCSDQHGIAPPPWIVADGRSKGGEALRVAALFEVEARQRGGIGGIRGMRLPELAQVHEGLAALSAGHQVHGRG